MPEASHTLHIHTALRRGVRKTEARQGGYDQIKCVRGITTVTSRVGQEGKNLGHLEKAAGPAMGHDQGHGAGADAPFVDEMNVQAIHQGRVMVPAVELYLLSAPIEVRTPVVDQGFEVLQITAIVPPRARKRIGKTGMAQTLVQIV